MFAPVDFSEKENEMDSSRIQYDRWLSQPSLDASLRAELSAMADDAHAIDNAFGCELTFGTGGLRGILGAGTNRMNVHVVRRAAQAVADYLSGTALPKRAAIGYDSRIGSARFARETAAVFAANGIEAYIYPRLEPVPALSFAVRALSCGVGVCITASHNPAQYNGFKVYGSDGCQLTPAGVAQIAGNLKNCSYFNGIQIGDFAALLASGSIRWIPDELLDAYIDAVRSLRVTEDDLSGLRLVYTPLNGSGRECVEKLLEKLGVQNLTLVPEQAEPDGNFPTCPYPNPEIREAMQKGLELSRIVKPDLLIGTDPDCDRCGVAVPDKGSYRLLSGNEVGVLLLDFICRTRKAAGTLPEHPVAVTTIVSTAMADPIAKACGAELRRTLTGFKYIGEQIGLLEREGHPERFTFGFEESYGYLSGTHVRDKDGVNAVLLLCEAASWYQERGMTLADAIDALYERFGCYVHSQQSLAFSGAAAMTQMASVMQRLRSNPPSSIGAFPVAALTDYLTDPTGLPRSDVLAFSLTGSASVVIRPSGTEPKLKLYLSAKASTRADADAQLYALEEACRTLLQF